MTPDTQALFDRFFGTSPSKAGQTCTTHACADRNELADWFKGIAEYCGKARGDK